MLPAYMVSTLRMKTAFPLLEGFARCDSTRVVEH